MQDQEKINEIRAVLSDLVATNKIYADEKIGTYFDYDQVLRFLKDAAEVMQSSARNPRPADLPKDIPWRETFVDPDAVFEPSAFDGNMSLEDHELVWEHFERDKAKGLVDDHGEPCLNPIMF